MGAQPLATKRLSRVSRPLHRQAWQGHPVLGWSHMVETNSLLFRHTLEYQNNMIQLITRSQEAIQALHERIWKVVCQVMESAGKSVVDGLRIALLLVDSFQPSLATDFQHSHSQDTQVYTRGPPYASPLSTDQGAMTVLGKEIWRVHMVQMRRWCRPHGMWLWLTHVLSRSQW